MIETIKHNRDYATLLCINEKPWYILHSKPALTPQERVHVIKAIRSRNSDQLSHLQDATISAMISTHWDTGLRYINAAVQIDHRSTKIQITEDTEGGERLNLELKNKDVVVAICPLPPQL